MTALVLGASACSSGDSDSSDSSAGSNSTVSRGPISVADDRVGQDCAADDAAGDTGFEEPTFPAPTIDGVERFKGLTHNHVDGCVDYTQNPPVGGDHRAVWQACTFYDRAVPVEQGVHAMEHGSVWITYDPNLAVPQRAALADLARDFVLVSPWNRDPLPSPIVASAWGLQLAVESVDDPRLAEFIETYSLGPQNPEPNAPCRQNGSTETL